MMELMLTNESDRGSERSLVSLAGEIDCRSVALDRSYILEFLTGRAGQDMETRDAYAVTVALQQVRVRYRLTCILTRFFKSS